jgi:hypothetical protein
MFGLEGALPLGKAGQGAGLLRCVVDGVKCSCTADREAAFANYGPRWYREFTRSTV